MFSRYIHIRGLLKNHKRDECMGPLTGISSIEDNGNTDGEKSSTSSELSAGHGSDDIPQSEIADPLTTFERIEFLKYKHLYYAGVDNQRKIDPIRLCKQLPKTLDSLYAVFDDKDGYYLCMFSDHLAFRYEIIEILGIGTYGTVIRAFDHKHSEFVALKIGRSGRSIVLHREIGILLFIQKVIPHSWEYAVTMKNYFSFRQHNCLVFELLQGDVIDLLRKNDCRGFSMPVVKRITKCLLVSLAHLHQNCIMHGDVKPDNLLKCRGKIHVKVSEIV